MDNKTPVGAEINTHPGSFSLTFLNGWTVSVSVLAVPPVYRVENPDFRAGTARAAQVVAWFEDQQAMEVVQEVAYPAEIPGLLNRILMRSR